VTLYRLPDPLRVVAFDIDNTLYENPAYADFQYRVLIEELADGLGVSSEEAHRQVDAYKTRQALERAGRRPSLSESSAALGFDIATSVEWRLRRIAPEDFLSRDEHLQALLRRLSPRFVLAAITNNPVDTGRRSLRALGIEDSFQAVVGLDSTHASKPNPLPFRYLADTLQIPMAEILVVGDRYGVDLAPALEIGGGAVLVEGIRDTYALCELLGR
jgi:FMN phosphatase YigB (HAD superfamily)